MEYLPTAVKNRVTLLMGKFLNVLLDSDIGPE